MGAQEVNLPDISFRTNCVRPKPTTKKSLTSRIIILMHLRWYANNYLETLWLNQFLKCVGIFFSKVGNTLYNIYCCFGKQQNVECRRAWLISFKGWSNFGYFFIYRHPITLTNDFTCLSLLLNEYLFYSDIFWGGLHS